MTEETQAAAPPQQPPAPTIRGASSSIGALAGALAKAQAVFTDPSKDKKVDVHKKGSNQLLYSYHYADLASVLKAIRKPLGENGLALIQQIVINGGIAYLATTLAHDSGEWIRAEYVLGSTEMDNQTMGGKITYARRYSISSLCGVASEDDDDLNGQREATGSNGSKQPDKKSDKPAPPARTLPTPPNNYAILWWDHDSKRWEFRQADDPMYDVEALAGMLEQINARGKKAEETKNREAIEYALRDRNIIKAIIDGTPEEGPQDDVQTPPADAPEDAQEQPEASTDPEGEAVPESTPEGQPRDSPRPMVVSDPVSLKLPYEVNHIKPIDEAERHLLGMLSSVEIPSLIFPAANTCVFNLGQAEQLRKLAKEAGVIALTVGWLLGPWLDLMEQEKRTMKESRLLMRKAIQHYPLQGRLDAAEDKAESPPKVGHRPATDFEDRTLTAYMAASGADKSQLF